MSPKSPCRSHRSTPLGDRGANLDHRRSDNFPDSHRSTCALMDSGAMCEERSKWLNVRAAAVAT